MNENLYYVVYIPRTKQAKTFGFVT